MGRKGDEFPVRGTAFWAKHPFHPTPLTALSAGCVVSSLWLWHLFPRLSFQCRRPLPPSLLISHTGFGRLTYSHGLRLDVHPFDCLLAILISLLRHTPPAWPPSGHLEHLKLNIPKRPAEAPPSPLFPMSVNSTIRPGHPKSAWFGSS